MALRIWDGDTKKGSERATESVGEKNERISLSSYNLCMRLQFIQLILFWQNRTRLLLKQFRMHLLVFWCDFLSLHRSLGSFACAFFSEKSHQLWNISLCFFLCVTTKKSSVIWYYSMQWVILSTFTLNHSDSFTVFFPTCVYILPCAQLPSPLRIKKTALSAHKYRLHIMQNRLHKKSVKSLMAIFILFWDAKNENHRLCAPLHIIYRTVQVFRFSVAREEKEDTSEYRMNVAEWCTRREKNKCRNNINEEPFYHQIDFACIQFFIPKSSRREKKGINERVWVGRRHYIKLNIQLHAIAFTAFCQILAMFLHGLAVVLSLILFFPFKFISLHFFFFFIIFFFSFLFRSFSSHLFLIGCLKHCLIFSLSRFCFHVRLCTLATFLKHYVIIGNNKW